MLFFTLLVAVIVVIASSSKIFEEDYRRPAVTQQMVDQINVSETQQSSLSSSLFMNLGHEIHLESRYPSQIR